MTKYVDKSRLKVADHKLTLSIASTNLLENVFQSVCRSKDFVVAVVGWIPRRKDFDIFPVVVDFKKNAGKPLKEGENLDWVFSLVDFIPHISDAYDSGICAMAKRMKVSLDNLEDAGENLYCPCRPDEFFGPKKAMSHRSCKHMKNKKSGHSIKMKHRVSIALAFLLLVVAENTIEVLTRFRVNEYREEVGEEAWAQGLCCAVCPKWVFVEETPTDEDAYVSAFRYIAC
jgi:hypothetical protein